jgi:GSH-dependent disulfide-bond oxidoreductase
MAGQLSHFTYYAPQLAPDTDHAYGRERYSREYERLIGVMERRLAASGGYLGGPRYTIADMAAWPWVKPWKRWRGGRSLADSGYPLTQRWYEAIKARPATERALAVLRDEAVAAQKSREGVEGGMSQQGLNNMFGQSGAAARSKL